MTIGEAVDEPVQSAAEDRHDKEHEQQAEPRASGTGGGLIEAEKTGERQPGKAAEHEQVTVGEVNEFDDPVDHRVAQGDKGDDHAVGQPDDQLLQKNLTARHAAHCSDATKAEQPQRRARPSINQCVRSGDRRTTEIHLLFSFTHSEGAKPFVCQSEKIKSVTGDGESNQM